MTQVFKAAYSRKRWWCALLSCITVIALFWSLSRYPDLIGEWERASQGASLDRQSGAISKAELMSTSSRQPAYERAAKTSINWLETNARGMVFGILFGSCVLVLLGQTPWIRTQAQQSSTGALFSGLALGAPLGVCANCATPIGLSMYKSGIRLETVLATMIASPALNPIGLVIVFSVFPLSMALLKLVSALLLILVIVPSMLFLARRQTAAGQLVCPLPSATSGSSLEESWYSAAKAIARLLVSHFWYVISWTVPFMVMVAVLAGMTLSVYPLERLLFLYGVDSWAIIVAAMIGALLPAPMFVDIIIVLGLLSFGMAKGPATALLISLGPVSIYASIIIWRHVSRSIASAMLASGAALGIAAGFAQVSIDRHITGSSPASSPTFVVEAQHNHSEAAAMDVKTSVQNFVYGGASWGDYDNDGHDDLWVSSAGGGHLYHYEGAQGFVQRTREAGITAPPGTSGGVWADYDADGDQDLLILYYGFMRGLDWRARSNMLWRNEGDGTFSDQTRSSGLFLPNYTTAAAWGDYDNDGDLDLYVSNYGYMAAEQIAADHYQFSSVRSQVNQLFRNNGDGTFEDVAEKAGVAGREVLTRGDYQAMTKGREERNADECFCSFQPAWFDFDNDGDLDLFVANDFGSSQLYRNTSSGKFEDVTTAAGIGKYSTGMGVAITDINKDGYLDFYETTIEDNPLWINTGNGGFTRTRISRLLDDRERFGWGVAFLDYDNDANPDLMIVNGLTVTGDIARREEFAFSKHNINSFYRNLGDGDYVNVLQEVGLTNSLVSRGLAVSDYNQDGYPDVYVTNKVGSDVLYRNTGWGNAWLAVRLRGTISNLDGIGATITVVVGGTPVTQLVTAGASYASQHSLWHTFGLGRATHAEKVIVQWPGGSRQVLSNVEGRQRLLITQP